MTKKISFVSLATALWLSGAVVFNACSSDDWTDEAEQTRSRADFLRAKAKEFSEKYGVDMSLNEENMDELVQTLTVEQMEKDFQTFAALEPLEIINVGLSKDRHRITRRGFKVSGATTTEEGNNQYKGTETESVSFMLSEGSCSTRYSGTATISWQVGGYAGSDYIKVSVDAQSVVTGQSGFGCVTMAPFFQLKMDLNLVEMKC